jgi:hypothetical protein
VARRLRWDRPPDRSRPLGPLPDLSLVPDLCLRPDLSLVADLCLRPDLSLVADLCLRPDLSLVADLCLRPDLSLVADLCLRPDLSLVADLSESWGYRGSRARVPVRSGASEPEAGHNPSWVTEPADSRRWAVRAWLDRAGGRRYGASPLGMSKPRRPRGGSGTRRGTRS